MLHNRADLYVCHGSSVGLGRLVDRQYKRLTARSCIDPFIYVRYCHGSSVG